MRRNKTGEKVQKFSVAFPWTADRSEERGREQWMEGKEGGREGSRRE